MQQEAFIFPTSFAQERMWLLEQLDPDSPVRNMVYLFRLAGALDVPALENSLNEVVRRHEAVRTTFSAVDGQPVQVIAPALTLPLPVVDLTALPQQERQARARLLAEQDALQPFDLARGPLLRMSLLQLGPEDHLLVLVIHHTIADGWSMSILFREISSLYGAFSQGQPSPLPDLPIQYADFAVWQRDWLQGDVLDAQLDYWRQQLDGAPPVLELPADRPRPRMQSHRGARHDLLLPQGLVKQLAALSEREGATLFMTLLAAYKVLLNRYTGQEDVVVGTPVTGRSQYELEGLIGVFINNLVLRTDLSGNPSFKELLRRVRSTALGAYDHQALPFEKLLEALQPPRDTSRTPLFQVFFNQLLERVRLTLPGIRVETAELNEVISHFDLTVYVRERDEGVQIRFTYNADLFDDARMAEMAAQYVYLLEQIAAAPETRIRSYSLVTPQARKLLPDPAGALEEPRQEPVPSIFSARAERDPHQPAIRQGQRSWTYAELSTQAHTLAQALLAKGLAPGDVVAVFGDRSFGLIASLLGTLMSGAVLLPIDPNLPVERQRLMLREARAQALVCIDGELPEAARLAEEVPSGALWVAAGSGQLLQAGSEAEHGEPALPQVGPDDPAYVFFTSGTTGIPKGVLGCHKGLAHFVTWQRDTFAISLGDRASQLTALSFDVVLREIFTPLASGATLCLPEKEDLAEPGALLSWLERERVTILHIVPSVAQLWLAHVPTGVALPALRRVFFAGEPLTETLVRQWRAAFGDSAQIVNLYGPTETTMVKCYYPVPAEPLHGIQPVGRPMPQTQALVLTDDLQLCGIAELGEIVIRTPFRTLGYINASEENRKRFVPNPYRDDKEDLLYRTGDGGRYRPDGTLEILGRLDDQVKIRGVRVEPGEVTATLARHPGVEACAVIAREDKPGEIYLAAYTVAAGGAQLTAPQLRAYLEQQLPPALVPSAFVFLDQLPLTPNGKLDRRALPAPEQTRANLDSPFIAPQDELEAQLVEIWEEVLDTRPIGVQDSFFQLGGDSLKAMRVMARVREAFNLQLAERTIFETPTVAGLATAVVQAQEAGAQPQAPGIARLSREARRVSVLSPVAIEVHPDSEMEP